MVKLMVNGVLLIRYSLIALVLALGIGAAAIGFRAGNLDVDSAFRSLHYSLRPPRTQNPIAELDFEIVGGRIYVPAEVNGHKTSVLLDTGAAASVMDLGLAQQWNLSTRGEVNVRGTGSAQVKGKILSDAQVSFGGIMQPIQVAVPLDSLAEKEGRRLEVIVGHQFFQTHIVEVDYGKRHLRVFNDTASVAPKGTIIPIRLVHNKPHITSEVVIGGTEYKLETMVDTGASTSTLTAKFLKDRPLKVTTTPRMEVAGGVGGSVEGRLFRPDSVKIGSVSFTKAILTTTETAGGGEGLESAYDFKLGADLLRRFRVTFDYPNKRMILEAGDDALRPFEADKTGLRIQAHGSDLRSFRIVGVLPGSSAEKADVAVGDVIETVDEVPASKFALHELRELFRSPSTNKWKLGIRRGSQPLKRTVVAKSVI